MAQTDDIQTDTYRSAHGVTVFTSPARPFTVKGLPETSLLALTFAQRKPYELPMRRVR